MTTQLFYYVTLGVGFSFGKALSFFAIYLIENNFNGICIFDKQKLVINMNLFVGAAVK